MQSDPIKNTADINAVHRVLTRWGNVREAECFIIGCNFALRVGDLLKIKLEQVKSDTIILNEQKTGKQREITINNNAKSAIDRLINWYQLQNVEPTYLFQATGNRAKKLSKPITARYLNMKLAAASEALQLGLSLSSHSMRKSFGYNAYVSGVDVRYLQILFNHRTELQTLTYIGISKKTISDVYLNSSIGVGL
ncbi:MAG: tyrosine-type recombinase/integrase [Pseudoalteromonas prydzensis]|uniref:tyrosine-type recombinase/integrase n=1 Tax=Pseudoalteromonas prydzensis TaxID=182141 RepID=UPI003F992F6F